MISKILTLCTGNICRSPVACFVLREKLPHIHIESAGLHAVVGRGVERDSATAAAHLGVHVQEHSARQFDWEMGAQADLVLVMDRGHLDEVRSRFPDLSAKCFTLRHHRGGGDVPDPHKQGLANHYRAVELIIEASHDWVREITDRDNVNG